MKNLMLVVVMIVLAGCATPPTEQELASADYGAYPGDYEQVVEGYMQSILKDPDSARYEFLNSPKKGWAGIGNKRFGYVVCANINAKNSFGGYTGNRLNYFFIKDGSVIDASLGEGGDYGDVMVGAKCRPFLGFSAPDNKPVRSIMFK